MVFMHSRVILKIMRNKE